MAHIREAKPSEAAAISALALRSKNYWQYGAEAMAVFERELTLQPTDVTSRHAHVFEDEGQILGFYTLLGLGTLRVEVEHIFVDPPHVRKGIGRALFRHACHCAHGAGAVSVYVRSDPHAADFYKAIGGALDGMIPSSIPGRQIPTFLFSLPANC